MVKSLEDGDDSEASPVTNSVKQGGSLQCGILGHADWCLPWLPGRNTGQKQDWRWATVQPLAPEGCYKVKKTVIRHFLFADDFALNANTEQTMQHEIDCLCQGCDNFVTTSCTKNTEVMYQPMLNSVNNTIAKARVAFERLRENFWRFTVQWYSPISSTPELSIPDPSSSSIIAIWRSAFATLMVSKPEGS